jgi:hypothetical protein
MCAPSLKDSGVLMIFEEKITSSKTFGKELGSPIWLNHDYGDGVVVDISAVDAYSGVVVCTPLFLGEASK